MSRVTRRKERLISALPIRVGSIEAKPQPYEGMAWHGGTGHQGAMEAHMCSMRRFSSTCQLTLGAALFL